MHRQVVPKRGRLTALLGLIGLLAAASAINAWLEQRGGMEGAARVIDGDSLFVAGREVRLAGIDAPEGRQTCTRDGQSWPCGEEARRHLSRLIGSLPVRCSGAEKDQHDRLLATCEAGGRVLNRTMVIDGYAVAYGRYRDEEQQARTGRRGLWSGEFERPRDWRDQHMRR